MTADQQVKEIILMMSPEDAASQTDAVFLVQKYMQKSKAALAAKDKQIALLEARLEDRSKEKEEVINEKLKTETRLRKENDDKLKDFARPQVGGVEQKPVTKEGKKK